MVRRSRPHCTLLLNAHPIYALSQAPDLMSQKDFFMLSIVSIATRRNTTRLLPLAFAMGMVAPVSAQSLIEMYNAARNYDATYQAAKLQYDATIAKAEQAKALVLPTVGLTVSATRTNQELVPKNESSYGNQIATLGVSQPLYNAANWSSYEQGQKQNTLAQAQLNAAEQDLIVRVSQAYFDALTSLDSLTFVKSQKAAVSEQLAFAKRNFEVGTSTITDTREAQARFDLVVAQELAAENDLLVKNLALTQLIGLPDAQPNALSLPFSTTPLEQAALSGWIEQAMTNSPALRQLQIAQDVAKLETSKAEAGHKPTLDLSGSYSEVNNNGTATLPNLDTRVNQAQIGLTFKLPLFAGFAVQNKVKETLALEEKARADLEASQRTIAQTTRTAFFGVQSLQAQVKAYEAAEASSQSALDANKLGYQVGVRINIDVLNSQTQLFDTKAKLAKARYEVLMGGLKLRQIAGVLKAEDLQAINAQLVK